MLESAIDDHEFSMVKMKFSPQFDAYRGDPRFEALLKRVGFPDDPPAPVVDP